MSPKIFVDETFMTFLALMCNYMEMCIDLGATDRGFTKAWGL